jgi:hypothetical protein
MYITDSGDFDGTLMITPQIGGVDQAAIDLSALIGSSTNGTLGFFGITNNLALYSGFHIDITQLAVPAGQYDITGFDDITLGDLVAAPGGIQTRITQGLGAFIGIA